MKLSSFFGGSFSVPVFGRIVLVNDDFHWRIIDEQLWERE